MASLRVHCDVIARSDDLLAGQLMQLLVVDEVVRVFVVNVARGTDELA